jgi:hypothetical protein
MTVPIPGPIKPGQTPVEGKAERFPIVVAEWPRNGSELIRIALDRYKNREIIDIRSWWQDTEQNWCPGRRGITLAIQHLERLAEGLAVGRPGEFANLTDEQLEQALVDQMVGRGMEEGQARALLATRRGSPGSGSA